MGRSDNEKVKCRSLLRYIPNCGEKFVLKAIPETVKSYSFWGEGTGENGQLGILVFYNI